jgi:hypothetical protein
LPLTFASNSPTFIRVFVQGLLKEFPIQVSEKYQDLVGQLLPVPVEDLLPALEMILHFIFHSKLSLLYETMGCFLSLKNE